jgi:acyl carrier protein
VVTQVTPTDPQRNALFERVRDLVSDFAGVPQKSIRIESRFEQDLGIVGDDLVELIDHLFAELRIAPGGFDYRHYASAEGLSVLGKTKGPALQPMTIQMWIDAAIAGRWPERSSAAIPKLQG